MSTYAVNAVTLYRVHATDANGEPVGPILSEHNNEAHAKAHVSHLNAKAIWDTPKHARRHGASPVPDKHWTQTFFSKKPAPASV